MHSEGTLSNWSLALLHAPMCPSSLLPEVSSTRRRGKRISSNLVKEWRNLDTMTKKRIKNASSKQRVSLKALLFCVFDLLWQSLKKYKNCTPVATSRLTCNGCLTKAGSYRPLQYRWNDIVRIGRVMSNGVELAASFVLNNPINSSCEITNANIIRPWTSGQNAAALSYSWL